MATMHFHSAACAGKVGAVQECIDNGMDAMEKDKDGNSVLHWAVHKGNTEIVKMVLAVTKEVNNKNNAGNTPLHYAAINNKSPAAKLLLEAKADPNMGNEEGHSPLHGAVSKASQIMIKTLCEHMLSTSKIPKGAKGYKRPFGCADPNLKDKEGFTPLHHCTYRFSGGSRIWKALIACGADENIMGGEWGCEPMHPTFHGVQKIMKLIPLLMLPIVFLYWFILRPTIEEMKLNGSWEREYGDLWNKTIMQFSLGWEQFKEYMDIQSSKNESFVEEYDL